MRNKSAVRFLTCTLLGGDKEVGFARAELTSYRSVSPIWAWSDYRRQNRESHSTPVRRRGGRLAKAELSEL